MNNTQFSDKQITAFTVAAEAMKENGMDYWPHALLGLSDQFALYCMEDDCYWIVNHSEAVSMGAAKKLQMILSK